MSKIQKKPKNEFLVGVGKNIQRFRILRNGMTQEALADLIGSNATYISKIETGTADGLTLIMLEKFTRVLNISVADLVDLPSPEGEPLQQSKRLSSILYTLPKHDKKFAEKILIMMLEALKEKGV